MAFRFRRMTVFVRITAFVRRNAYILLAAIAAGFVVALIALPRYQEPCNRPIVENDRIIEWIEKLRKSEPDLASRFCGEVIRYPLSGPVWPHAHTDQILASISDTLEFVRKNKLSMWPSGGVYIGAVRHGGYWDDDDIDLDIYVDTASADEVVKQGQALIDFLGTRATACHFHQCDHCAVHWSIIKCEKKFVSAEGKDSEILMDINLYMRGDDADTIWGPYAGTYKRSVIFPLRPCRMHHLTMECPHDVKGYMGVFNEAEYEDGGLLRTDYMYSWKYPRIDEQIAHNVRLLHACGYSSLMQYLDPAKAEREL